MLHGESDEKNRGEQCAEGLLTIDVAHLLEDATENPPAADRLILL